MDLESSLKRAPWVRAKICAAAVTAAATVAEDDAVNLYEAKHYRDYIKFKIENYIRVRGYRTRLAKASGFSPSFLSQVMHESVEITPEHAIRMAQFWELDDKSTEYWMLLVDHGRAGSITLRRHIEQRMERMARDHGFASAGNHSSTMVSYSAQA